MICVDIHGLKQHELSDLLEVLKLRKSKFTNQISNLDFNGFSICLDGFKSYEVQCGIIFIYLNSITYRFHISTSVQAVQSSP